MCHLHLSQYNKNYKVQLSILCWHTKRKYSRFERTLEKVLWFMFSHYDNHQGLVVQRVNIAIYRINPWLYSWWNPNKIHELDNYIHSCVTSAPGNYCQFILGLFVAFFFYFVFFLFLNALSYLLFSYSGLLTAVEGRQAVFKLLMQEWGN